MLTSSNIKNASKPNAINLAIDSILWIYNAAQIIFISLYAVLQCERGETLKGSVPWVAEGAASRLAISSQKAGTRSVVQGQSSDDNDQQHCGRAPLKKTWPLFAQDQGRVTQRNPNGRFQERVS